MPYSGVLIVREAMRGRTRFAEFQQIGVPTSQLTDRLEALVEAGILAKRPYQEPGARTRVEYTLTPVGRGLMPVIVALAAWADEHRPTGLGPATVYVDGNNQPVHLAFVHDDGTLADQNDVVAKPGPGRMTED